MSDVSFLSGVFKIFHFAFGGGFFFFNLLLLWFFGSLNLRIGVLYQSWNWKQKCSNIASSSSCLSLLETWWSTCRSFLLWAVCPHCCCCCWVASVVSDSVRPHRRQPTRLPRPRDSPGKNTGVGCHLLLNAWKWKVKTKPLSCVRLAATPGTAA